MNSRKKHYQLILDVPFRAPKKLFCSCSISKQPFRTSRSHPQPIDSFKTSVWHQDQSHTIHCSEFRVYLHDSSNTICGVDQGIAPPQPPSKAVLTLSREITHAFQLQVPSGHYVIRYMQPKYSSISGFQRSILIGQSGPSTERHRFFPLFSIELKESGCRPLSFSKNGLHVSTHTQGQALLSWTTEWFSNASEQLTLIAAQLYNTVGTLHCMDIREATYTLRVTNSDYTVECTHIPFPSKWAFFCKKIDRIFTFLYEQKMSTTTHVPYSNEKGLWSTSARSPHFTYFHPNIERDPECSVLYIQPNTTHENDVPLPRWNWVRDARLQGLSQDCIYGLLQTGRVELFERIRQEYPRISVQLCGELLYRWPRALEKKGIPTHALTQERFLAIAALYDMEQCQREIMFDLLIYTVLLPQTPVHEILTNTMGVYPYSENELRTKLKLYLAGPLPKSTDWQARERFWMGRLMRQLRGSIEGRTVRWELYRYFSQSPPTSLDRCPFPPATGKKKSKRGRPSESSLQEKVRRQ